MRRSTRRKKPTPIVDDTNEEEIEESVSTVNEKTAEGAQDSSSDSDIENYLQPADKLDFDSEFFQIQKPSEVESFEDIEQNIFAGVNKLSSSESDEDEPEKEEAVTTTKLHFEQLHSYANKLEEVKQVVQSYNSKWKEKDVKKLTDDNISDLLASGEMQADQPEKNESLDSNDFHSCSEVEDNDWEEVDDTLAKPSTSISKDGIQITVALPDTMKKKKGVDLLASVKRRLNRIKKEHQLLIHKVHLLCWIAHGNYVNKNLNNETVLGLALSLIPSQHCYPPSRTDLTYLEQILNWFHVVMPLSEKSVSKQWSLEKLLKLQLNRKQAYDKKMLVYIFICILRSLGIQCRLVLSFQVLPIRPSNSDLHSLSTKSDGKNSKSKQANDSKVKNDTTTMTTDSESLPSKVETKSNIAEKLKKNSKIKNDPKTKSTEMVSESLPNKVESKLSIAEKLKKNSKIKNESKTKSAEMVSESLPNKVKTKLSIAEKLKKNSKIKNESKTESTNNNQSKKMVSENVPSKVETKLTNADQLKKKTTGKGKISKVLTTKNAASENTKTRSQTEKKSISDGSSKAKVSSKPAATRSKRLLPQLDGVDDSSESEKSTRPNLRKLSQRSAKKCSKNHGKRLKKVENYEESSDEEDDEKEWRSLNLQYLKEKLNPRSRSSRSSDVKADVISIVKTRIKREKEVARSKMVKGRKSKSQSDDDSDYAPEAVKKKYDSDDDFHEDKVKVKRRISVKGQQDEPEKTKKGMDVWVEVYLEAEEKWISVDVVKNKVHCVQQLYARASHPVSYIVAWNNNNSIKDITQRYCVNWNTTTRKLRIDAKWWDATLKPYIGRKTARDKEEDEELMQLQLDKPLPSTISEYKNHPLYVLKRHLLKFEALYPPDVPSLGFVRGEPVYARDCVHVLHSREIWLKEAKVVNPGEQPYKVVKARPKYDKLSGKMITDLPLEVFGVWQVGDYVPPTAENGIVPRNAYGNVELFKPCMLPKGTVHLQLPGLNKVARKMGVDCVSAVVGFDFHSGWNHPVYDGFVVCEEHSEALVGAWYQEQEEQEKKEVEKVEKRVYGNWRKLIRGLLIRERLKKRYDYGEPSQATGPGKKRKQKGPKVVAKKRRICSDSESD